MEAIEKLRQMTEWFNLQSEYFNQRFKTVEQLEKVYDYAKKNNLEFLDDDYLYSGEIEEQERVKVIKFIDKLLNK